ncbi:hypothetical protein LguiA_002002 [Lonicera macranthoides]
MTESNSSTTPTIMTPTSMSINPPNVVLPSISLDETNYPTWMFRMESFLRSIRMYELVDGTYPCPPECINSLPNPAYENWRWQDQYVINMLGQTLSPVAMTCAVGSTSAADMWLNLKNKYAASNRQNKLQLKSNFQSLKKGNDTIEMYLDKVKAARDTLATVGVQIDDEDVIVTVLRGLPTEYTAIKTVIRAQFESCGFTKLKTLLKAAETDIESESIASLPITALMASTHVSNPHTPNSINNAYFPNTHTSHSC